MFLSVCSSPVDMFSTKAVFSLCISYGYCDCCDLLLFKQNYSTLSRENPSASDSTYPGVNRRVDLRR